MSNFKKYERKGFIEARPVDRHEIISGKLPMGVSVSKEDIANGSPNSGDMIARDPNNHNDMWLINKEFFNKNYKTNEG